MYQYAFLFFKWEHLFEKLEGGLWDAYLRLMSFIPIEHNVEKNHTFWPKLRKFQRSFLVRGSLPEQLCRSAHDCRVSEKKIFIGSF